MNATPFKPFVFVDAAQRPYRVQVWGNSGVWLFYWHPNKRWVAMKALPLTHEVEQLRALALSDEHAALYDEEVRRHHPTLKEVLA